MTVITSVYVEPEDAIAVDAAGAGRQSGQSTGPEVGEAVRKLWPESHADKFYLDQ